MQQAARRSWRLGQTYDVRVCYAVYRDTMEHRAMSLIANKWQAAEMLVGDSVAAALAQESESGGSFLQELANSVIRNSPVDDLQTLFKQRVHTAENTYIGFEPVPIEEMESVTAPAFVFRVEPKQLAHGKQLSLF